MKRVYCSKLFGSGLILLCLLGVSSQASALPVDVPALSGGFQVGISALYELPLYNQLDAFATNESGDNSLAGELFEITQAHDWGVDAFMRYIWPGSSNDMTLRYSHASNRQHRELLLMDLDNPNAPVEDEIISVFPTVDTPPFHTEANYHIGKTHLEHHLVDLSGGQHLHVGSHVNLRLFAGLRYADITHRLESFLLQVEPPEVLPEVLTVDDLEISKRERFSRVSTYHGLGPRFGADARYHVTRYLDVLGSVAGAVLLGASKTNYYHVMEESKDGGQTFFTGRSRTVKKHSRKRAVSAFDVKLALAFHRGMLDVEAGYKLSNFHDALDALHFLHLDWDNIPYQSDASLIRSSNSVAFAGPYVTLSLHF